MNRTISPHLAVLALAVGISVITVSAASAGQLALGGSSKATLDGLSSRQLIDALDESTRSDPDRAQLIKERLWQQRGTIQRPDVISAITDDRRSQESRELMVDLLAGDPDEAKSSDDVRALLRDGRLDSALKARLIVSHEFSTEDSALLDSLASGSEEPVAFHALKKLGSADPVAARRVALAALSRADGCSDSKLSASYKVLVRSGTLESDRATRGTLLRHLTSVLAVDKTSPELRDSATFALADMRSLEALRILLGSAGVDRALIGGAIDQNALLIKTALEQNPDEATIALAITAMELHPVSDIAEPLGAVRSRVKSPALRQRLEAALVHIANEGIPMNPKWTEE
ncbi:MAG: hypothetical protein Q7W30_05040 [Coriobacteriia bacterium]|nr:hypothetical protein [Coriobacteriia bacterium]